MTHFYKGNELSTLKETVDLRSLVESLGFKVSHENNKEIRATCCIHGGDNKSAFRLNKQSRTWICFTNKCHEEHGYDLLGLIKGALGVDFKEAVLYLKNFVGNIDLNTDYVNKKLFNNDYNNFIKKYAPIKKPEYVTETHLKAHKYLRSQFFILKDKFKSETLDYFEIAGGFKDKHGVQRDIIPIRNEHNDLVAYSLRDIRLNPPDEDYKYILTEGFIKDLTIYNLHNAKNYGNMVPLIVVEGFKSVWRLYEYGIYNVVAVMGSCLTPGQISLLKVYALKGVIVLFDADNAGKIGAENGVNLLNSANVPTISIDISDSVKKEGDSPAEVDSENMYRYLNEYIR